MRFRIDPDLRPPLDITQCSVINRMNAAAIRGVQRSLSILENTDNEAGRSIVQRKKKMAEVLYAFAAPWSGIVPPIVPLICRAAYIHAMTCRRMAWNIMDCYYDEAPAGIDDPGRFYMHRWSRQGRLRHIHMFRSVL